MEDGDQYYCGAMTEGNGGPSHPMVDLHDDTPVEVGATWGDFPYVKIDDPDEFGCSLHPNNSLN
jgi:hypothetical protein